VELSYDSYRDLLDNSEVERHTPRAEVIERVGTRIARSTESFLVDNGMENQLRYYDWEFNLIVADDTVNAFCMPGGKIAVYTGILPVTEDETGLAVVMGHEVAHAIAHHGRERVSQQLLVQMGGIGLGLAASREPEGTRMLLYAAYGVGTQVGFLLPYSRTHELEADRIGLILMASAGYDPRAAVDLWKRMDELGGNPPEFLSTHPHPGSRIEQIKKYLPEALEYYE
jgi:predicted Zn-dependent protease